MFSDTFMQKSVHHHQCSSMNRRHSGWSSSKAAAPVLIPKRKSAPNTISRDVKHKQSSQNCSSLLRQQSLPPTGSLSCRHTKHTAKKLVLSYSASSGGRLSMKPPSHQRQQSIPSKGSPKPPLLERTHTVHSEPVVFTHTRAGRNLVQTNNAPAQGNTGRRRLPSVENTHRSRTTVHSFEQEQTNLRAHRVRGRSVDAHIRVSSKASSGRLLGSSDCLSALPYSLSASQVSREHSSLVGEAEVLGHTSFGRQRVDSELFGESEMKVSEGMAYKYKGF